MLDKPCVYKIICPYSKKVKYVGHTHDPKSRFRAHTYKNKTEVGAWIQSLIKNNRLPIFEIIESFDYNLDKKGYKDICNMTNILSSRELFWINFHLKNGDKLFNKQGNLNYQLSRSNFIFKQP